MIKNFLRSAGLALAAIAAVSVANQADAQVVISQVYAGSGVAGPPASTYTRDYVELFNTSYTDVTLNNHAIQYGAAGATTWTATAITNGSVVPARGYLLITRSTTGGATGSALTGNVVIGFADMANAGGKVALTNSVTALSGAPPSTTAAIVDIVGWGTANYSEGGAGVAAAMANNTALYRLDAGCFDTNNNTNDFSALTPLARTNVSPKVICPETVAPTVSSSTPSNNFFVADAAASVTIVFAEPVSGVTAGALTVNGSPATTVTPTLPFASGAFSGHRSFVFSGFTAPSAPATITLASAGIADPSANAMAADYTIVSDATAPVLTASTPPANTTTLAFPASVALTFDDPLITAGVTAEKFTVNGSPATSVTPSNAASGGHRTFTFTGYTVPTSGAVAVTLSNTGVASVNSVALAAPVAFSNQIGSGNIKISQVYLGGGAAGTYTRDYVEFFNAGYDAVHLENYIVQYVAPTASTWTTTTNTTSRTVIGSGVVIAPRSYVLLGHVAGTGTSAIPTPEISGAFAATNMAVAGGKIALFTSAPTATNVCATTGTRLDYVGWGTSNCSATEGAPVAAPTNTQAIVRNNAGCDDTNVNSADFTLITAPFTPRNSASPAAPACTVAAAAPTVSSSFPANNFAITAFPGSVVISFSEAVTGVTAGALSVAGSPATSVVASQPFGGGNRTFTFTGFTAPVAAPATITLTAAGIVDLDATALAADYTITSEAVAPTISGSTPAANTGYVLPASFPATITITFSEAVSGVTAGALTVAGSPATTVVASNLFAPGVGSIWTFSGFTAPTGNATIPVVFNNAGVVDRGLNVLAAGTSFNLYVNDVRPTVVISSSEVTNGGNGDAEVAFTATFSEPVTGFSTADFSVTNAIIRNFSATSTTVYTFTVRPITGGALTVAIVDSAALGTLPPNNTSQVSNTFGYTSDPIGPRSTVLPTITSPRNLATGPLGTLSFTFDEPLVGFTIDDIVLTKGFSNVDTTGLAFALSAGNTVVQITNIDTYTATDGLYGLIVGRSSGGTATDAAGNNVNRPGVVSWIRDTALPTATLTAPIDNTIVGTTATLSWTINVASGTDYGDTPLTTSTLQIQLPGSTTWNSILAVGQAGNTLYNFTANGRHNFRIRALDGAGNEGFSPERPIYVNLTGATSFTQTVAAMNETVIFPITSTQDILITFNGATPGGTITVGRNTSGIVIPVGFDGSKLIDETLTITGSGLGTFTANLAWDFDPANVGSVVVNTIFRFNGGANTDTRPASVTGNRATATGITGFSEWFLGESNATVTDWSLLAE